MSQYPGTFNQPYNEGYAEPPKTSGLAITALVCSLIFCCPITTVLGVILGAIAMVTIGSAPGRKGKGLAIAAVLLGVIFTIGQVLFGMWFYRTLVKPVMEGPREALVAGFSGDISGFKSHFYGAGATATDADAQQFIEELRTRYGTFVSVKFDEQSGQSARGQPGQPEAPFPYVMTFQNKPSVKATTVIIFVDQKTGAFVFKLGSITVHDSSLGDVKYPPEGGTATTTPGTTTTTNPAGGGG
jgi:hypothetical protein